MIFSTQTSERLFVRSCARNRGPYGPHTISSPKAKSWIPLSTAVDAERSELLLEATAVDPLLVVGDTGRASMEEVDLLEATARDPSLVAGDSECVSMEEEGLRALVKREDMARRALVNMGEGMVRVYECVECVRMWKYEGK